MRRSQLARSLRFAGGVLHGRPFQVFLQVTNRCNMRCGFCDFWPNGVEPRQELSLDDYRQLEEELATLGTFLVSIEGGEPFVRDDVCEIVRIFSARHLPVLYTNGWYVGASEARALFEAGVTNVGVSIDFADPKKHDQQRGLAQAWDRAWRAVEHLRQCAPRAGQQVHVMTVLMKSNVDELDGLLEMSAEKGVGHCLTLLALGGFRRGTLGEWPRPPISRRLVSLWKRHSHLRIFRDYLAMVDPYLRGEPMPRCRAGLQSFNIDHVGNVAPCIEKIDTVVGNVRREKLVDIHHRLIRLDAGQGCQRCWTACRGFGQAMGAGGTWGGWRDMATRMRSY